MVSKQQAAEIIRDAQLRTGTSWNQIARAIDRPAVWTVAALLGQHPMTAEEASKVGELLGLDDDVVWALQLQPYRGSGKQEIPTDPTIYRLYEAVDVYGAAIKELVHEEFGDGIMSAINFKIDVTRRPDPTGDRVVITFDGKFLDYNW